MCGIVGYVGPKDCSEVLVNALTKLEYRGYDSAGIAVFDNGDMANDLFDHINSDAKVEAYVEPTTPPPTTTISASLIKSISSHPKLIS